MAKGYWVTQGAWYRRWRLVAVDGTVFDVPDTAANAQFFGRPGTSRGQGRSAYPQARVAALAECGTHAVFAAEVGPLGVHETALAQRLFPALTKGMLVLADRGFCGLDLWRAAKAGGADLLWRVRSVVVLPVLETLADGSYLSEIVAARDNYWRADPERVRVIEYTLGPSGGDGTVYRLITTVLDPEQAPAEDQRWEIENTLDEIKNHQGVPGLVLRSQHPRGVEQEIFAFLLVHHALRDLMHQAALKAGHDPDRISFTRTLRVVRRHVTGQAALSPLATGPGHHPEPA
ncbi:IS4 family transposase [Streptomyces sp. NPDC007905]|uniref:IS4 family transposase n=1 Tax=Streptomyces sp. NPDC007905 TaxID=3364788 RepID=UPI0036EA1558